MSEWMKEYERLLNAYEMACQEYWMECACNPGEFCVSCQSRNAARAALDAHVARYEALREAATGAMEFFEANAEQVSYGYGRPDDPRDFSPDLESCTPEEIANHAAARQAWDAAGGEPEGWKTPLGSGWNAEGTIHTLRAPWGIGTYVYRDPELCALRDELRAALAATKPEDL